VKAPELQEYLQRVREKIWGGLDDAADVVLENVRQNRDAKMSYELLRDAGLLPRAAQVVYQPRQPMTTEEEMVKDEMVKMAYIAYETAKTYGGELPDLTGLGTRVPKLTDGKEKIESKTDADRKKKS
jgi:hypothetical protein